MNFRNAILAFTDRTDFAGGFARPLMFHNRTERTGFRAKTAVHAFDLSIWARRWPSKEIAFMVASALAAMGQTPPAGIGDFHPADRALIARWLNHFEDVRIVFIAT
jgi:hypothetical protein